MSVILKIEKELQQANKKKIIKEKLEVINQKKEMSKRDTKNFWRNIRKIRQINNI